MIKPFTKKEIESKLSYKMEHWIQTLKDVALETEVRNHYIITGGAIVSLLLQEEPNDYDIYFDDVRICEKLVNYYCRPEHYIINVEETVTTSAWIVNGKDQLTGPGFITITHTNQNTFQKHESYYGMDQKLYPNKGKYTLKLVTTNSITLTDQIQVVTRICGSPMDIHKTFDFLHCVSYFTPRTGLVLNRYAMESILTKELKYKKNEFPIDALFRMRKFIERGWTISNKEILKIAFAIMSLPLEKKTLNYQLPSSIWKQFIDELPDDVTSLSTNELLNMLETKVK